MVDQTNSNDQQHRVLESSRNTSLIKSDPKKPESRTSSRRSRL